MDSYSMDRYISLGKVDGSSQVNLSDEDRDANVFWNPFVRVPNSPDKKNGPARHVTPSHFAVGICHDSQPHRVNKVISDTTKAINRSNSNCVLSDSSSSFIRGFPRNLFQDGSVTSSEINFLAHLNTIPKITPTLKRSNCIAERDSRLEKIAESSSDTDWCICDASKGNSSYSSVTNAITQPKENPILSEQSTSSLSLRVDTGIFLGTGLTKTTIANNELRQIKDKGPLWVQKLNSTTHKSPAPAAKPEVSSLRPKSIRRFPAPSSPNMSEKSSWELYLWDCEALSRDWSGSSGDDQHLPRDLGSGCLQPTVDLGMHSLLAHVLYPELDSDTDLEQKATKRYPRNRNMDSGKFYVWESETDTNEEGHAKGHSSRAQDDFQNPKDVNQNNGHYFWEKKSNQAEDECVSSRRSASRTRREGKGNVHNNGNKNTKPSDRPENCDKKKPTFDFILRKAIQNALISLLPLRGTNPAPKNVIRSREGRHEKKSSLLLEDHRKSSGRSRNSVEFKLNSKPRHHSQPSVSQRTKPPWWQKSTAKLVTKISSKVAPGAGSPALVTKRCSRIFSPLTRRPRYGTKLQPVSDVKGLHCKRVLESVEKLLQQLEDLDNILQRVEGREGDLRGELAALTRTYEDSCADYQTVLGEFQRYLDMPEARSNHSTARSSYSSARSNSYSASPKSRQQRAPNEKTISQSQFLFLNPTDNNAWKDFCL